MAVYHDEVEIEDLEWCPDDEKFYYPCPCGDRFEVSLEELQGGEEVAKCPSCSLIIRVVYQLEDLSRLVVSHRGAGQQAAVPACA